MGRIGSAARGIAGGGSPIGGGGAANQVAYFSGASTITGSSALVVALASTAGVANSQTLTHADNTATASHAYYEAAVGGTTSTGDPQFRWTIPSGTSWVAGPDNSNSDTWMLCTGTTIGSNIALSFVSATGIARFGSSSIRYASGQASTTATAIFNDTNNDGSLEISGGFNTATGANIVLNGGAHATPSLTQFRVGGTVSATISAAGVVTINGASSAIEVGVDSAGSGSANNLLYVRKNQNAVTRSLLVNGNTGASAVSRYTLTTNAGDFDITAGSTASGALVSLAAASGFTGGISINADDAAGVIILKTAGATGLSVSAAQVVTVGTGTSTVHRYNSALGTNGAGACTILNGPAGTSGDPAGWERVNINGTVRARPFWATT